ncbi:MAG: single-stranded DNA-binding protein [Dehalococcoidales bacterium]|jgi:single-strand DNA-binding protein|nr:single-stranded DNA-binding protein [Dehalococcoidales bacterium]
MVSLNKVMLIGRVGTDPECRYTPSGVPVVSFRLAVSRFHTSSDGQRQQDTDWFTVVAWNKLAEQCNNYLSKRRLVYVEGRLHTRSWESDGKTNYRTEIVASVVTFLDRQESNEGGKASDIMEDDGTLDISFDDGGIVELD